MQNYNKIQKFLSFLLIFSILFSFTIHTSFFSFLWTIFASDTKNYNVVSIFVQEEIYDDVKSSVDTYARNIQKVLENTKTMIVPIPGDTHPFNIASLNEKLYFEWYNWLDSLSWNSRLIWSIFVWDLALPVVEKSWSFEKTVFPYVDFEDKLYIFDSNSKNYKINSSSSATPKAEIWHGFISPNTWNLDEDIKEINNYFTKNNDFYNWTWNFENSKWIMNGKEDDNLIDEYKPYVFYYDQIRESKAVKYVDYKAYEWYLANIEDITYNRFSAELAEKLKKNYFWAQWNFIWDVWSLFWSWLDFSSMLLWPTTKNVPDIQTRHIIQNTTKKFLQIFNWSSLWEFRKDVHNAWRYNSWSNIVNVDLIPALLTNVDLLTHWVLKNVNNDLENVVDNLVEKWLSKNIAVPSVFEIWNDDYTNYLYWNAWANMSSAKDCTIYRWSTYSSGQLVEANRAFNINNIQPDLAKCRFAQTMWYWWGNSPANLDTSNSINWEIRKLKSKDITNAVVPIYDILGSLKSTDTTKNPDPRNCFNNNFILTEPNNISCSSINSKLNYSYDFDYTYKNFPTLSVLPCEEHYLNLDWVSVKTYSNTDCASTSSTTDNWDWTTTTTTSTQTPTTKIYNFHKIASYIKHKSPTSDELYKQTQYMLTPNLPIDKDRYIDFIAADNTYGKINYPYLFRVILDENEQLDLENARKSLKKYLDQKSSEINSLITAKNPSRSWADTSTYWILKTWAYPSANIDLYKELENKPDKEVEILWEKKTLSYIDTLIFAILWNNFNSVWAKYKFIFENYLSDQFGGNSYNFYLPKNKKQYEIAYLWALWDAKNMYVKLDPEDKAENPYSDIIAANQSLNSYLFNIKWWNWWDNSWNFKCAPPEWVPIWQWIPAIMCRLKDMVPPKISITDGNCWLALINKDDDSEWFYDNTDINKNGIVDYLENEIKNGSLKLKADSQKYYYNKTWFLDASILNASWSVVTFDNASNIKFELLNITVPKDETKEFNELNSKVLYDKNDNTLNTVVLRQEAEKYLWFKDIEARVTNWKVKYNFSTKSKDSNVKIKAILTLKDQKWNVVIQKSDEISFFIRWDLFYASSYKLSNFAWELELDSYSEWVIASKSQNIYLIEDSYFNSLKTNLNSLNSLSSSKEKMFLSLINNDKNGNSLNINYPLVIKIFDKNEKQVIEPFSISNLSSPKSLWSFVESGIYTLEIKDKQGYVIKKEINILPDIATRIEPKLSTNLIEANWVITTNVFTIYDQYDNPAAWENYTVEAVISWNSVVFENWTNKQTFQVFDGFKLFRLKTTSKTWDASIKFNLKLDDKNIDSKTINVAVVEKINFDLEWLPSEIKVGNNTYNYSLKVEKQYEKTSFNSKAYLITNNVYLKSSQDYINIIWNSWTWSFQAKTKAWEKIKLEFKIEWVKNSVYKEIDILPDLWVKVDLTLSKSKIEADKNATSTLYAEIKDKYNNIVWTDNSTILDIEILDKYKHIIKTNKASTTVSKWKWNFTLNWTVVPGTAYFKVSTNPSLSNNKIEIIWQAPFKKEKLDSISGMRSAWILSETWKKFFTDFDLESYRFKYFDLNILKSSDDFKWQSDMVQSQLISLFEENNKIIISWVWENVWKIETFYFWNKDKILWHKYNSLYTTLLWSNYWDITIKDNLANSIIFDKNNRALWVTSLLNDSTKHQEVLNINPNWNLKFNYSSTDISQDFTSYLNISDSGNLEVSMYNNTFESLISKVYFNLKDVELMNVCSSGDFKKCYSESKNSILLKSINTRFKSELEWNSVKFKDENQNILLEVNDEWKITKSNEIKLEISSNHKDGLVLNIKRNNIIIWNLAINLVSRDVKIIRDISLLQSIKSSQQDWWIIVYLEWRDYFYKEAYLWSSTKEDLGYIISYNDPFASNSKSVNHFWNQFEFWYEQFYSKNWIGWKEDNKILLSFSAWKSIWEATKDFMTFSLINVWDPVASLKPIPKKLPWTDKTRKYDATIWYLISKDDDNIWYNIFDYNNDLNEDVLVLKRGWYVELLEWTSVFGDFINRWNILYLADLSTKSPIISWDFSGDGYWDIVLLNKDRKLIFISNDNKNFKRINTNISFDWMVNQVIGFDMDKDWKKDLVILDDMWDLYIFYWTSKEWTFVKLKLDSWLWLTLDENERVDGWAIYYDWLYQLPIDKTAQNVADADALLKEIEKNKDSPPKQEQWFNEWLVDKLVFTQMNYLPSALKQDKLQLPKSIMTPEMIDWIKAQQDSVNNVIKTFSWTASEKSPDLSSGVSWIETWIQDAMTWVDYITNNYKDDLTTWVSVDTSQNSNVLTTFLKSEYSKLEWLEVTKKYTDLNWKPIRWWDGVNLNIKIKNNTLNTINNIAYNEKIPDAFNISSNSPYKLKIWTNQISSENIIIKSSPSDEYTIFLDSYNDWGIQKYISLNPGETLELNITLTTNAFEYWFIDAWFFDDQTEHGDIIFKLKNENCWKENDIYKSIATREYKKDKKLPSCKNDLPDSIEKNAIDTNNNGVPDYIDDLLSNTWSQQTYSKEQLWMFNKDTDKDWLPDKDDISTTFDDSSDDFMNSLDIIDMNVEEIMAWIDVILAWLSCWFGWGWCIAAPINRAPLASWQDLSLFWLPTWDGLNIDEWLPVFSALTWMWYWPICWPSVWPISPLTTTWCWSLWAWGRLWINNVANFLRIYITPTLTWAMWIEVCFWWPARLMWQSNPKWMHPFVPGWNCIVAAMPMFWCKDDWSDWEIQNMWEWNIINWNCTSDNISTKIPYLWNVAWDYIDYKKTWRKTSTLEPTLKEVFSTVARWPRSKWELPNGPLLNIWSNWNSDLNVDVDFWALKNWNFEDVLKIQMTRISPFPDFIMEWVTRQIEEIANKLTDFPTLYVILPDFGWVFDSDWSGFMDKLKSNYDAWEQKSLEEQSKLQSKIDANNRAWANIDCNENSIWCLTNSLDTKKLEAQKNIGSNKTVWGVKSAYEFISNMPIIKIETQKVNFNAPWIDKATLDKAIKDFQATKIQWKWELDRAKKEWNIDSYNCIETSQTEACKNVANVQALINSIDKNIEILQRYKKIPEDIFKMVKIKEVRIEQILCNLETISKITGWRIWDNWKRFKAWVELYVLIKAVLKSWQLLVDVFIDYDAECHECKNERYDLLYFVWKLISAAMPKIPVIQFPKWPDIYLDLHNIRVSIIIWLPEFEFNLRPILIPPLPRLYLPNSPNVALNLPTIPLLPIFELAQLPELPSLPKIELPNLPPPPKLPKLLSAIEAFLNILKIITKVMCILKTSPFVPEWRAWDQIAFITERSGYLAIDFLDMSLPQFSFPFVDAIKVTTFVNLEFEVEFLVEMARQTALPINAFTNDIANMLNIGIWDLDYRWITPTDLDVDVRTNWINSELNYNFEKTDKKISLFDLSNAIALNILKLYSGIEKQSKIDLSNTEFKDEIAKQLPNIKNEKIIWVWQNALNYSFEKEDKLINDLIENNEAKYNEVRSILQENKYKDTNLVNELKEKLLKKPENNVLVNAIKNPWEDYNTRLEVYNEKSKKSIENLFVKDSEVSEIKIQSKEILSRVQTWFDSFSAKLDESKKAFSKVEIKSNKLLATNISNTTTSTTTVNNSAQTTDTEPCDKDSSYKYVYKWIYIVEKFVTKKISYFLFDYLDELTWKEITKEADFDRDWDQDIIYMVWDEIYLKENFNNKKATKEYYTGSPIILKSSNNPYLSNDFISWVNGFEESISDNNYINIWFKDSKDVNNYRVEFYQIVDKFDDVILGYLWTYTPKNVKRYIIDAFSDIENKTLDLEKTSSTNYYIRKNLAYINNIWNLAWVELYTKDLINLNEDISSNKEITINSQTKIFTSSDSVRLTYYLYRERDNELKLKEVSINAFSNIEFKEDIILVWITWEAFVEWDRFVSLTWNQIANYIKKPLLPWSKIIYNDIEVKSNNSYIGIKYYDWSEAGIDFNETKYYELYDLWLPWSDYLIRTKIENDFYYGKIRSFKNNLFSTYTNTTLLSPQKESDKKAPEISNLYTIKLPVYQKKIFNITDNVFENSWIKNITDMYIDFDLEKDSSWDGNLINDKDFSLWQTWSLFDINIEWTKLLLQVWDFSELINKTIRLYLVDSNNNIWYKNLNFVVYSPTPKIESIKENKISWKIDEVLKNEPISFYRIRNSNITRLEDYNKNKTANTSTGWEFSFEASKNLSWATITHSWEILFKINEETWKIILSDFDKAKHKLDLKVSSSDNKNNEFAYPKITISKDLVPIYYEYLVTPNSWKVEVVKDFSEVIEWQYKSKVWIYYNHNLSDFEYISLPVWINNNSWDLYIYSSTDSTKKPIITIFKDWRINVSNEMYYLEYSSFWDYVVYNIKRLWTEAIIWKVMIIPEKNYIVK